MKFLLDAHLPPSLCGVIRAAGHEADHVSDLPSGNRTPDRVINQIATRESYVVVSKDPDFYYSHGDCSVVDLSSVSNRNHHDGHHPVLQAAEDPPVADAVSPKTVLLTSKWLAELFRVCRSLDPGFQKSFDLGGG
jgi:predicted nuclease of predicted toxin-antitoxin system